jgi:hypothetical protein
MREDLGVIGQFVCESVGEGGRENVPLLGREPLDSELPLRHIPSRFTGHDRALS